MTLVLCTVLVVPVAWMVDLMLGDPEGFPHPVRWMGAAIGAAEPRFRALPVDERISGALMAAALILLSWAASAVLVGAARWVSPAAGAAVEAVIVYACISTRSLATEAESVHRVLADGDLPKARTRLGRIVGRDTGRLSRGQIARAAVETVAENLVDGVVAPLFFAALGGAPLAAAYRMVNTLDAMIGYRNPRYRRFGAFAARTDDAANWIPARISVALIAAAAQILCRRGSSTFSVALADGRRHTSPNAGYSEAAFAGALRVKLGGPSRYGGMTVSKPFIGGRYGPVRSADILRARDLMVLASLLTMAAMTGLAAVLAFLA